MQWLYDLLSNEYLIIGISSWFVAQVLKTIIHAIVNRKLDLWRMVGDGGMPSAHSATVTSVAVVCGLLHGLGSVEFAISTILAIVVCHDATGVRRETGKQAVLLNEISELVNKLSSEKLSDEVKLKVFVGHTLPQVIAGILTGTTNALLMHYLFF